MEEITRDGDIITIKSEVVRTIDLAALRAELASLQMDEPSDQELLDHARAGVTHPFFDPTRNQRITEIENLLGEYE